MEYEAPTVIHSTIESDGYGEKDRFLCIDLCAGEMEIHLIPVRAECQGRMDDSERTKYAVLFRV